MKPYSSHPRQPKQPHKSWIKRVRDVVYDLATQTWRIQLECFHKLELPQSEHSMKVAARWCPSCQFHASGKVTV